jgi:hypothetical protein
MIQRSDIVTYTILSPNRRYRVRQVALAVDHCKVLGEKKAWVEKRDAMEARLYRP